MNKKEHSNAAPHRDNFKNQRRNNLPRGKNLTVFNKARKVLNAENKPILKTLSAAARNFYAGVVVNSGNSVVNSGKQFVKAKVAVVNSGKPFVNREFVNVNRTACENSKSICPTICRSRDFGRLFEIEF